MPTPEPNSPEARRAAEKIRNIFYTIAIANVAFVVWVMWPKDTPPAPSKGDSNPAPAPAASSPQSEAEKKSDPAKTADAAKPAADQKAPAGGDDAAKKAAGSETTEGDKLAKNDPPGPPAKAVRDDPNAEFNADGERIDIEKKKDDDKKKDGDKKTEGDKKSDTDKKGEDDKKPEDEKKTEGDKKPEKKKVQLPLTDAEKSALADMEKLTEGALEGYNKRDAEIFARGFSATAIPPANEEYFRTVIIGIYHDEFGELTKKKRTDAETNVNPNLGMIVYEAEAKKRPKVKVSVNFRREEGALKIVQLRMERM